ncbi:MAG: alpha/beta fold hydrolase, partial [Pseudomonadota bacterium]
MKTLLAAIAATALVAVAAIALSYWSAGQGAAPTAIEARYITPGDRFLDVAGAQIRIREEGPQDAPALLLLHGFLYSLETWDAWAERLSTDYRVIRYDLLGHGLSGPDTLERYAPKERAAFVGDVLDALSVERAIVAGNSLGGLAAWRFAATHPERVSALILVAPGGYSINGVSETPVNPPAPMRAF